MPVSNRRAVGVVADGRALYGRHVSSDSRDVRHTEMRAAELVRRAQDDVGVDRADVHRLVGCVVDGVDPGDRAGGVGELAHATRVDERADHVRRPRERDDACAIRQLGLEVCEIQRAVGVDVDVLDDEAEVVGELDPRSDVAVVVEPGHEDLVTGLQRAPEHAAEREVERGHVRAEHDLGRAAVEEAGPSAFERRDRLDPRTGRIRRSQVRARVAQGVRDRRPDLVGHLRPARRIEEAEAGLKR